MSRCEPSLSWTTRTSQELPNFHRFFVDMRTPVGSWTLEKNGIWAPCWLDAYPAPPLLCSTWGGYADESWLFPDIKDDGL